MRKQNRLDWGVLYCICIRGEKREGKGVNRSPTEGFDAFVLLSCLIPFSPKRASELLLWTSAIDFVRGSSVREPSFIRKREDPRARERERRGITHAEFLRRHISRQEGRNGKNRPGGRGCVVCVGGARSDMPEPWRLGDGRGSERGPHYIHRPTLDYIQDKT